LYTQSLLGIDELRNRFPSITLLAELEDHTFGRTGESGFGETTPSLKTLNVLEKGILHLVL
jgi:hypothetical protein